MSDFKILEEFYAAFLNNPKHPHEDIGFLFKEIIKRRYMLMSECDDYKNYMNLKNEKEEDAITRIFFMTTFMGLLSLMHQALDDDSFTDLINIVLAPETHALTVFPLMKQIEQSIIRQCRNDIEASGYREFLDQIHISIDDLVSTAPASEAMH